ncbi:helix-turn-helix transcriptional regulator [Nocardia rhizosphaerae]|uniref:Helix-turn-helix transcriptional regulator n=1 Tax=Nocardia rhizosphaerae TaxID=1691571 RepID=A0ABV8LD86_9NOCA
MRADRLLRLIVLLQRHGRLSAPRLSELLEVSERTVLRDMEALSAAGVPVYTERGRNGGCFLLDGFKTDATGLTAGEAQALFAWAGQHSAGELGLGADLTGALAKIAASAGTAALSGADRLRQVLTTDRRRWFAEDTSTIALPLLREAAVHGRRVRIHYSSRGAAEPLWRTVDPWGLVDQSGRWYLVAAHDTRPRTYRVDRIAELEVLDSPLETPRTEPVDQVWQRLRQAFEASAPEPVAIDVVLAPQVEKEFLGAIGGLDSSADAAVRLPDRDGRHRWRIRLRCRRTAVGLAIWWAPDVVVEAPDDLLAEIRQRAGAALAAYTNRTTHPNATANHRTISTH